MVSLVSSWPWQNRLFLPRVLVALNLAALKNSLQHLNQGGLLIINEDSYQDKDWQKAGMDKRFLDNCAEHYHIVSFPLITQTQQAVAALELTKPQATKTKNFYVLGLVLWLFDLPTKAYEAFITKKFKANPVIAKANEAALVAGYNYAMTLELARRDYMLGETNRQVGEYRQITGVEAIGLALATVATHTDTHVSLWLSNYPFFGYFA